VIGKVTPDVPGINTHMQRVITTDILCEPFVDRELTKNASWLKELWKSNRERAKGLEQQKVKLGDEIKLTGQNPLTPMV
jgi:hypothetical protein